MDGTPSICRSRYFSRGLSARPILAIFLAISSINWQFGSYGRPLTGRTLASVRGGSTAARPLIFRPIWLDSLKIVIDESLAPEGVLRRTGAIVSRPIIFDDAHWVKEAVRAPLQIWKHLVGNQFCKIAYRQMAPKRTSHDCYCPCRVITEFSLGAETSSVLPS
jgi:hypothetical protein